MTSTLGIEFNDADLELLLADVLREPPANPPVGVFYCGVYARISSDPRLEGLGVERQIAVLTPLARSAGFVPVLYVDNNVSASRRDVIRPEYQRMVADLTAGRIHTVAAWDTTRLFRDNLEQELFMGLVVDLELQHSVLFHSGGEKDLTDYTGQFEFRINGAVSARHVAEMKAKQRVAFKQRAELGRAHWSTRPFGFNWGERNGTGFTVNPTEQALIAQAYEDVLNGRSLKSIARDWQAAGVVTPKGNTFCANRIRRLLLSPRNAGLREYTRKRGNKIVSREIVGKADWPAIVDERIWRGVVAKLRARTNPNSWTRKHLLSGLLICGACESRDFTAQVWQPPSTRQPSYICKSCKKVVRSKAKVEAFVETLVINALADQEVVRRKLTSGVDTVKLTARIEELNGKEAEFSEAIDGGMKYSLIKPKVDAIIAERTALEAQRDAAQVRRISKATEKLRNSDDVARDYKAMDDEDKRTVIAEVLTGIIIYPGQKSGSHAAFDHTRVVPVSALG